MYHGTSRYGFTTFNGKPIFLADRGAASLTYFSHTDAAEQTAEIKAREKVGNLPRGDEAMESAVEGELLELYFQLGGADYLQACRQIACDHREPTPTLEDAVCGMAGTVAAICALCEDENSEVSDLARELYYSSLLLQELVEWYQSRRQEQESYEEEYEQYHGFDMTMM